MKSLETNNPCGDRENTGYSILSAVWELMRLSEYKLHSYNTLNQI
jgi:hypothetical protein